MSKWEDSLKKTLTTNNNVKICHCSNHHGLFISNRSLSFVVAGLFFLTFSAFMAGYFLGKKKTFEQFMQNIHQDVFSDHIYTTMMTTTEDNQKNNNGNLLTVNESSKEIASQSLNENFIVPNEELVVATNNSQRYYAQLIGFGTEKAAQLFAKKMLVKGIETEVKKRIGKTVKGRTSYWYQVVTTVYSDKNELSRLVSRLEKEENIKNACIQIC